MMRNLAVVFLLGVFLQGSLGAPTVLEQGSEVASGSYTGIYLKKDNAELKDQQKVVDAKADLAFDAKLPSTSDVVNDADEALNSMNDELDGESRLLSAIHPVSPQIGEGKEESDDEKADESTDSTEDPDPADASEAPDAEGEGTEKSVENAESEDAPTMDDELEAAESTEDTEEGATAGAVNVKATAKVIWEKAKALMNSVPKSSLSHNDAKQLFDAIRSTLAKSIKIDTEKKAEAVAEEKKVTEAKEKKDQQVAEVKAKYVQEAKDKARKRADEEEQKRENQRIADHDKRIADKVVSVIRAAGYEHDTEPHPDIPVKHDKAKLLLESELILKDLDDHVSTFGKTGHAWKGMWEEMHRLDSAGQSSEDTWESRKLDWQINKAMDKFRAKGSEFTEALMKKIGVEARSCDESSATKCVKKCSPCMIECDILQRWKGDKCDQCKACTSCQPYLLCTGLRDSYKSIHDSGSSLFPTNADLNPEDASDEDAVNKETKAAALERKIHIDKITAESMADGPEKKEALKKIAEEEAQLEAEKIDPEEAEKIIPSHHKPVSMDNKSGKAPTVSEDENKKNKSALEQAAKDVTSQALNEDSAKLNKLKAKKDADRAKESEAPEDSVEAMNSKMDVKQDEKLIENALAKVEEDDKNAAEANKDEGSADTKKTKLKKVKRPLQPDQPAS